MHPHAVAARLACTCGQTLGQGAPDAPAAEGLVHRQLVEEHFGALVGVGDLHAADEPHGPLVLVCDEQMVAGFGQEAGRGVGPGRAVEEMGGRRDQSVITGAEHPNLHAHGRLGIPGSVRSGRAWSAAQAMSSCRGSRPQATARLSDGPWLRPVPASRAIWTLAGNTAAKVARLAARGPTRAPDQADGADELDHPAGINEVGVVLLGDGARHDRREDLRADQVHHAAGRECGGQYQGSATAEANHGRDCTVAACQPK